MQRVDVPESHRRCHHVISETIVFGTQEQRSLLTTGNGSAT